MHTAECATETSRLTMVDWMTWQSIWTLPCTKILWSRRIRHRLPETSSPVQNSTKMRVSWQIYYLCDNEQFTCINFELILYFKINLNSLFNVVDVIRAEVLWHSITSRFLSHFYWGRILEMRNNITKTPRFPVMGKVVKAMLTVPNSNAECERVYSQW